MLGFHDLVYLLHKIPGFSYLSVGFRRCLFGDNSVFCFDFINRHGHLVDAVNMLLP